MKYAIKQIFSKYWIIDSSHELGQPQLIKEFEAYEEAEKQLQKMEQKKIITP